MAAAAQIADDGIDVVGHAVLLGDQVTGAWSSTPRVQPMPAAIAA